MDHPQTKAEEISKNITPQRLEAISRYGCCAFVLLWCLGIEPDDYQAIETVNDLIKAKAIEEDCTVKWVEAAEHLTGRKITVEFKGKSHWVGVENGMIKFNPLVYSQCVDKGRPVTARIIKLAK